MRTLRLIVGLIVALMGVTWALQGAWLLPATFMRGPEWIAIGGAVAFVGVLLMWTARRPKRQDPERAPQTAEA